MPFLVFAASLSAQATRSFLNEELKTPQWMDVNVQARWRSEGQHEIGFIDGNDQDFLLQRLRMSLTLRPTSWLTFYGEAQDARAFGAPSPDATQKDDLDLRQAYVDIGHESGWWNVKAGRQVLAFGSERLIGGSDWTNTARVFDAVKLGIHHGANRVDLFSSSVVGNSQSQWDHRRAGDDLHGAYASLGSLIPHAKVEPYVLWRLSPSFAAGPGATGKYHSWTYGARVAGGYPDGWNFEGELLGQAGNVAGQSLSAWGAEAQIRKQFVTTVWKPSILAEFNFASGDRHPNDGKINTLDQLYPTNHSIYGIVDVVGRRNTKNIRAGYWIQPRNWLTLKAEGEEIWLASRYDGLYSAGGALSIAPVLDGAKSTHVGGEIDGLAEIKLSRHYSIGIQGGHLFAGGFIQRYSPGAGRGFYALWVDFRL